MTKGKHHTAAAKKKISQAMKAKHAEKAAPTVAEWDQDIPEEEDSDFTICVVIDGLTVQESQRLSPSRRTLTTKSTEDPNHA